MKFQFNDGGRSAAGYKASGAKDCTVRAIAILTNRPYQEVYDAITIPNVHSIPASLVIEFDRFRRRKYHSPAIDILEDDKTPHADRTMKIRFRKEFLTAARCSRCRVKLYPPSLLEAHLAEHKQNDADFTKRVKSLRRTFNGKRQNGID
jgi:hypothetical protein